MSVWEPKQPYREGFPHHLALWDMHASRVGDGLGQHADCSDNNLAEKSYRAALAR